jgi:phi13 family phage major tail protein
MRTRLLSGGTGFCGETIVPEGLTGPQLSFNFTKRIHIYGGMKNMATIGLDRLYYAKITENENGEESYSTPVPLAKAITAELSVELAEATLYADDGAAEVVKEFQSGTLSLGVADIGVAAAEVLTGATLDDNNVLISASEDGGDPVAIGFRAKKANGKYRYFWLYRVKFGIPATNLQTKGDSITFSTPTIEGTVMRRNKPDGQGKHPWKAEVSEDDPGVSPETIIGWYTEVYEPVFAVGGGSE